MSSPGATSRHTFAKPVFAMALAAQQKRRIALGP
jgi:hypothetical protein